MPKFMFKFGFVTPEADAWNKKHDGEDQFSTEIFIDAETEQKALEWGAEVAEGYVKWLFKDDKKSWKKAGYANWIETDLHFWDEDALQEVLCVKVGEYPDYPLFHSR